MPAASALDRLRGTGLGITAGLIGWFILVEFVSGIIQGGLAEALRRTPGAAVPAKDSTAKKETLLIIVS